MLKKIYLISFSIFSYLFLISCIFATKDAAPYAPSINIDRFSGTWFEIARKPVPFENSCSVSWVRYKITFNKHDIPILNITNSCLSTNNELKQISGNGKFYDSGYNRRFLVSFSYIDKFWNLFSQYNYIIYYIDNQYSETIIGSPNRKYLWILSKDPFISKERLQFLLNIANNYQFDTKDIIKDIWNTKNYKEVLKFIEK